MPSPLECSFVHIPGIGPKTEAQLWRKAASTWREFLAAAESLPLGPKRTGLVAAGVMQSQLALDAGDARYFTDALSASQTWRAYPDFASDICYLDIETTGMYFHGSRITFVGVYDGARVETFIAGRNLDDLPAALERFRLVVTFNGATFDLPFLRAKFGRGLLSRAGHIDLRYVLGGLGLKGGLKAIEKRLGMERPSEVADLNGWDAVRLWYEYEAGSRESLRLLAEYNVEDILNLEPLLRYSINKYIERLRMPADGVVEGLSVDAAAAIAEVLGSL